MDGVSTMNLNDDAMGVTPLFSQGPPLPAPPPAAAPRLAENNVGTLQMDSTPISDLMGPEVDYTVPPQQQMYAPQTPMVAAPQKKAAASGNPMNMTNEQVEALLAGVVALVAFSNPVQEKLVGFLPQMLSAAGERSNTGLLVTALVAAILFYFGRRFVIKN